MRILGISAFYHDSAAALVADGEIVAAAQEERFTRVKHDPAFPAHAIRYCLEEGKLEPEDLDYVVFYDKPLVKFERLLETATAFAPSGFRSFASAMPVWLKEKLFLRRNIRRHLGRGVRAPLVFLDHHESHAASAFFPSPYEEAAILTLDGVGEWTTSAIGAGRGNRIELTHHLEFPHSAGLLYSAFTYYCGFRVNSGEYKLMGLAPYGRPIYEDAIRKHLIDVKPDGTYRLHMEYFNYCQGLTMTSEKFHRLFGGPPRSPESDIEQRHMDLAASIQRVTEDIVLRMGCDLHRRTGLKNLVMAGGVALNCVANGRLLREGPFDSIWVQPASGDAGGALGAALFVWHQLLENPRTPSLPDAQRGSFLGPSYDGPAARQWLDSQGMNYAFVEDDEELFASVAALLSREMVVGWVQGRMEFGPRALGARSILGDPRSPRMQAVMNRKIKFRESFRPFAPCVLAEHASDWFDMRTGEESPYMLMVAPVREHRRSRLTDQQTATMMTDRDLRRRVNVVRSEIPAATHVDYSARIQTVDRARNPRLHGLLNAFYRLTGCPILINTSFNVRGEPIVCTPQDAYRCFLATEMDALVIGNCLLMKDRMDDPLNQAERQRYLAQFRLD
ncbi:MAG: carbamoyltransferase [Bryobacteraceae bacterium]|nr:carbamoyltransferase [Bryobacteraceae bacterium]